MRSQCVLFTEAAGHELLCALCLEDASTDLRPYTRSFVFLIFQVYTVLHPAMDLHAVCLSSWPAASNNLSMSALSQPLLNYNTYNMLLEFLHAC